MTLDMVHREMLFIIVHRNMTRIMVHRKTALNVGPEREKTQNDS